MGQRFVRSSTGLLVPAPPRSRGDRGPTIITRRNFLASAAAAIAAPQPAWALTFQLIAAVPILATGGGPNGGTSAPVDTTGANFCIISWVANRTFTPNAADNFGNFWGDHTSGVDNNTGEVGSYFTNTATPTVGPGHTFSIGGANTNSQGVAAAFNVTRQPNPLVSFIGLGFDTPGQTAIQAPALTPGVVNNLVVTYVEIPIIAATAAVDSGFNLFPLAVAPGSGSAFGFAAGWKAQNANTPLQPTWTISSPSPNGLVQETASFALTVPPINTGAFLHSFPP